MAYHPLVAVPGTGVMGIVYLLHFNEPYRHAQHYWGWASKLEARLEHHANGTGGRLPGVVMAAGISWQLALAIPGDRNTERQMKNRGGARRLCPICKGKRTEMSDDSSAFESKARCIGQEYGRNAAEWAIDPSRLSKDQMTKMLQGIEEGDPEVMDAFREPNLGSECQDSPTPESVGREVGITPFNINYEAACEAWEKGAREAFWAGIQETLEFHTKED